MALFTNTLDRLGLPAQECVMAGDSPPSDGGASAAGITTVLCRPWGSAPTSDWLRVFSRADGDG